ncbi:glycosyltransferase family 2 protein [Hahella sp. SMD15-11]|uniref:Glycosyltransferase family 2 protein n=1 Tax=Thermohahella caldifontis TaxID=3142973 RepID=A0AB39UYK9_9GAMM
MMETLFWTSIALVVYIYAGYPLILWIWSLLNPRPVNRKAQTPSVSILISAYNEEANIGQTLKNKLELDYPKDKLEILVVSDCSTDRTNAIVEDMAARSQIPIRLVVQQTRQGKTAGLNRLVPMARGDILVFSDANSHYAPDAVRMLVRNFADPCVGYVTGKMIYVQEDGSLIGDGCSTYMRYENHLRQWETDTGSIVGVDGGIDAMRRNLYSPLRPEQLPDFVQPLKVVEQGYRVVYEPEALLEEPALNNHRDEFRMRVRVSLRALWALRDMAHMLNPLSYGLYSFKLWSHKVLRYLAFIPLAGAWLTSILLADHHPQYLAFGLLQTGFYGLALAGIRGYGESNRWVRLAAFFTLVNAACAVAFWRFIQGQKQVIWQPRSG